MNYFLVMTGSTKMKSMLAESFKGISDMVPEDSDLKLAFICRSAKQRSRIHRSHDIPMERLKIKSEFTKEDNIEHMIITYRCADYYDLMDRVKHLHRICYGLADERVVREFLGWNDSRKLAYETFFGYTESTQRETTLKYVPIGCPKFSGNYTKHIKDLINIDPDKPTIVFQHTWNKSIPFSKIYKKRWYDAFPSGKCCGNCDVDGVMKVLSEFTDKFNIIHKAHHEYRSKDVNGVFLVDNGEIPAKILYNDADIVIADWGGSAVEALMTDGDILYIDDPDYHDYDVNDDSASLIHDKMHHIGVDELRDYLKNWDGVPKVTDDRKDLIKFYLDDGNGVNIIEYLKELSNNGTEA